MVFIGFAVNYMVRINMNIALVAMVEPPAPVEALDDNGTRVAAVVTGTQCIVPDSVAAVAQHAALSFNDTGVQDDQDNPEAVRDKGLTSR